MIAALPTKFPTELRGRLDTSSAGKPLVTKMDYGAVWRARGDVDSIQAFYSIANRFASLDA